MTIYEGKPVCGGIAIGSIAVFSNPVAVIQQTLVQDKTAEWNRFLQAKQTADAQLATLFNQTFARLGEEEAEIFDVHRLMLQDPTLLQPVSQYIQQEGKNAAWAVQLVAQQLSNTFLQIDDEYMSARSADILDLANRVINILLNHTQTFILHQPSILLADTLTPSETAQLDKDKILAFVTRQGSSNSHTAILARTMNIPSIVQADIPLDSSLTGQTMAVDGYNGVCYLTPTPAVLQKMKEQMQKNLQHRQRLQSMRGLPSITATGNPIRLYANISTPQDLSSVLQNDAEGIGLFRSEFLYIGRNTLPTEEEQFTAYKKVAQGMQGKKVIIRTMDIGADKKATCLPLPPEENPALGCRGIRISLSQPHLLQTQLRAIYRASAYGSIAIMFPMVSSLWEVQECKKIAAQVRAQLQQEGIAFSTVQLGIMIETPAAALISDTLAHEVDFFSVGTNDLTQYTLAVDRQNPALDAFCNPHHPAVLALLRLVAQNARKAGIWAGICGDLAADTTLTQTFLEMGYDELSVPSDKILELRSVVRSIHIP